MKGKVDIFGQGNLHEQAERFFDQAETFGDTTQENFAAWLGVEVSQVRAAFVEEEWRKLRKRWLSARLVQSMEALYPTCRTRCDFSIPKIIGSIGISEGMFTATVSDEWRTRWSRLPTGYEIGVSILKGMVEANTPLAEVNITKIQAAGLKAGVKIAWSKGLSKAVREARIELERRQRDRIVDPPPGVNARVFERGWIDLDSDTWNLRCAGGKMVRRDRLREDVAEIAWPFLREALQSGELSPETVYHYYLAFIRAGEVLGDAIPNCRTASVDDIQAAWQRVEGPPSRQSNVRTALVRLYTALAWLAEEDCLIDGAEMVRILGWLLTISQPRPDNDDGTFLTEAEMDAVMAGCVEDIKAGFAFTEAVSDFLTLSNMAFVLENATPILNWAVALMILLMAFTGLRRQSIAKLEVGDWAELHPRIFALAWRHGKKPEENLAVVPASIVDHLQLYVERTRRLREALGTARVFLLGGSCGQWTTYYDEDMIRRYLHRFAVRHQLGGAGTLIRLTSRILRRTYTTRELYEGRSLWALRLQLGHRYFSTTLGYVKFDQFEHPTQIGPALDQYARSALMFWNAPVILEDLDPAEREFLLGSATKHDQEVGLCRKRACVRITESPLPPCSLCKHLATGAEYLNAWEAERSWRVGELERLSADPVFAQAYVQKKFQFKLFLANLKFLEDRINERSC